MHLYKPPAEEEINVNENNDEVMTETQSCDICHEKIEKSEFVMNGHMRQ